MLSVSNKSNNKTPKIRSLCVSLSYAFLYKYRSHQLETEIGKHTGRVNFLTFAFQHKIFYMSKIYYFLLLAVFLCWACTEEEPTEPEIPEQVVTTLRYELIDPGTNETKVLYYQDLDGNGGNEPIIESDTLLANSIYFGTLEFLNESVSPTENVSDIINAAKEDYQVFFIKNNLQIDFTYADSDGSNNPLGLFVALRTSDSEEGNLIINLQRDLDKFNETVQNGDIIGSTGKTVLQFSIPLVIR